MAALSSRLASSHQITRPAAAARSSDLSLKLAIVVASSIPASLSRPTALAVAALPTPGLPAMPVRRSLDPRTCRTALAWPGSPAIFSLSARVDRRKRSLPCFYHRKDLLLLPVDRLRGDRSWASRVAEEGGGLLDKLLSLPHQDHANAPLEQLSHHRRF